MDKQENLGAQYSSIIDTPVLITGGASGIGEAIVRKFAKAGAKVVFFDINSSAAEVLIKSLNSRHTPLFSNTDMSDIEAVQSAILDAAKLIGEPFRVLVNNAANDERHTVGEVTPQFWRERMAINLDHQFFCAQSVVEGMSDGLGGSIINFGSLSWRLGLGGMPAYGTAKAAIEGLTRVLARDFGKYKIRVNCVVPGFVRTQRQIDKWLTPEFEKIVMAGQCLPEFIGADDVANLVAFLAADESRMCTSQCFPIDAGWVSAGNS